MASSQVPLLEKFTLSILVLRLMLISAELSQDNGNSGPSQMTVTVADFMVPLPLPFVSGSVPERSPLSHVQAPKTTAMCLCTLSD